jgi:uncharacterized protein YpuA (DUF1002 family)
MLGKNGIRFRREWTSRRWTAGRCLALLAALVVVTSGPVGAASWRSITIGESNDEAERAELLTYFGAGPEEIDAVVTVADTQRAMDGIYDLSGIDSAYSSTSLTCRPQGTGLEVRTRNIEAVTPELYALALVTAGVDDAELIVAAPDDAPALGMTALTGVFATLKSAPCRPASTSQARQLMAQEELALAARIGQGAGTDGGATRTAGLLLETQRSVVSQGISEPSRVAAVVGQQERSQNVALPADERLRLIDLMSRLGASGYDWGSFARGWTIARDPTGTRVAMTGVGGARAVVPAAVGGEIRVIATPGQSATPRAAVTRVASPVATPAAVASPAASPIVAVTAVAVVKVAPPDEPSSLTVTGTVVGRDGSVVAVRESAGSRPTSFMVGSGTRVTRSGKYAQAKDVREGDTVRMTVDPRTGWVGKIDAEPAPSGSKGWVTWAGLLGALALIGAAAALFARRRVWGWLVPESAGPRRAVGMVVRRRVWVFGRGR